MKDNDLRPQARILVVDDEPDLLELLSYNLSQEGHLVATASNGFDAMQIATRQRPNLIILDVMMPEIPGTEVARRLRADPRTSAIPIIMLTARAAEADQVAGLTLGADDYITKPFSMRVLLARVQALLRRSQPESGGEERRLGLGPVEIDLDAYEARVDGQAVALTPTEFRLLVALVRSAGRALTRDDLVAKGMGPGVAVTDRAIDVHIAALRKKLGAHAGIVQTVRGAGYRAVLPAAGDAGPTR